MLYVARHGQTTWNAQNKVCGISDVDLTEKGIEQAKELAKKIKEIDIHIIITSPLKRAMQTAEIISNANNIPIEMDGRLIEQNYGIYEGIDRENRDFLNNKKQFAYRYPNGESMMQVASRIYSLLDEVKIKHKNKNVLIISHGGVCRIIYTYFKDMTNEEFFNYTIANAEFEKYIL